MNKVGWFFFFFFDDVFCLIGLVLVLKCLLHPFDFNFFLNFFTYFMYMNNLPALMCTVCMPGTQGVKRRASASERELQTIGSHHVGAEN